MSRRVLPGWAGLLLVAALGVAPRAVAGDDSGQIPAPEGQPWEEGQWQDDMWCPPAGHERWAVARWLARKLPHDPRRHIGLGQPLQGTSWLNRPWYAGCFVGPWWGDTLMTDRVAQDIGFFGGYWLGLDLAHYWGSELRLSYFYTDIEYLPDHYPGGSTRNILGDINVLYYPWGDSRWRPYASLGLGLAGFHFMDDQDGAVDHTQVALPYGFGVKYQSRRFLALRMELKDNLVFSGNGVNTTGNWSLIGGVEVHWGSGSAPTYYPW